jgi:hypothetical protein
MTHRDLVFVCVSKEDVGNDVRRVAVDDLVEQVCGVGQRIRAIPSRKHAEVIFDRVTTIMKTFFFGCLFVDPTFVLPEGWLRGRSSGIAVG